MTHMDTTGASKRKGLRIIWIIIVLAVLLAALIVGGHLLMSRPNPDTLLTLADSLTVEDVKRSFLSSRDYRENAPTGEVRDLQEEELTEVVAWINEIDTENLYYDASGEIGNGYHDRYIAQLLWVETEEFRILFKHSPDDPGYLQISWEWADVDDQREKPDLNPKNPGRFCLMDSPLVDFVEDWAENVLKSGM